MTVSQKSVNCLNSESLVDIFSIINSYLTEKSKSFKHVFNMIFCTNVFQFNHIFLYFISDQFPPQRHGQSYEVWLPLCSEDGCLSAVVGDHHFPARDLSLPPPPAHRTTRGQ